MLALRAFFSQNYLRTLAFLDFCIEREGDNNYNGKDMGISKVKRILQLLPLAAMLLLPAGGISHAQEDLEVKCFPSVVRQGDACLVTASGLQSLESVHGEFKGRRFQMAPVRRNGSFQGLLGIDIHTNPGTYEIRVVAADKGRNVFTKVFALRVEKATFGIQRLTLPSAQVDLDPETLTRVKKETARMKTVLESYRDERLWDGAFIRPVEGEITTPFGVRRILNGQERSPHKGVDLRAPERTPVQVCNRSVVVLVDELFFSGKTVVLDHGWGIHSMYFHLSEVSVRQGDLLAKGDTLGLAGSTGRTTGPHLHWGIRLNGANVDPVSILRLTEHLEE